MDRADFSSDTPPETLYKYASFDRVKQILEGGEIYFAAPREFNDPFDGLVVIRTKTLAEREELANNIENKLREMNELPHDWEAKKHAIIHDESKAKEFAKRVRDGWKKSDRTGFCCLTDNCQSLPMWAHYADNHKGCCLAFNFSADFAEIAPEDRFPFYFIKQIAYQDELPKYGMDRVWFDYFYKSGEWAYEREWRAVMFDSGLLPPSEQTDSFLSKKCHGFGPYPLRDHLWRKVILGSKMKKDDKQAIITLARRRSIAVWQATPDPYDYGMSIAKICDGL